MIARALAALVLALAAPSLFAQQVPDVRESVDPSVLRDQLERERAKSRPTAPAPSSAALPEPRPGEVQFMLRAIVLDGLSAAMPPASAFEPDYAALLGQPTSLAALEIVAARITARLRASGAILSQAVLPPQEITDGVVRIRIVEGTVSSASAEGDIRGRRALIDQPLARIAAQKPLSLATLERNLLLIGDLPGVTSQTVLQADPAAPGAAQLAALVSHQSVDGFVAIDNRASRLIGPYVVQGGLGFNSILGGYERIDLSAAATPGKDRLRFMQGRLAVPRGSDGDRIELTADYTRVRPDLDRLALGAVAIFVEGWTGEVAYTRPFVRTRAANVSARFAGQWLDTTNDEAFLGVPLSDTREELRVVTASLSADWDGAGGATNFADAGVFLGIDGLGAEISPTPPGVETDFIFATARLARRQPLSGAFAFYGEVLGQLTTESLPTSQRFNLGGVRIGRGFAPASANGDSGFAARVDLRWTEMAAVAGYGLQIYGFYDYGQAIDDTRERDGQKTEKLSSFGAGARIGLGPNFSVSPEIAHQLTGRSADGIDRHETRLFMEVVARF